MKEALVRIKKLSKQDDKLTFSKGPHMVVVESYIYKPRS